MTDIEKAVSKAQRNKAKMGELIKEEIEIQALSKYAQQKAIQRKEFLPAYKRVENILDGSADYGIDSLLMLLDALGLDLQIRKNGQLLKKS